MVLNETPYERTIMNPQVAKLAVKVVVSFAGSLILGYAYKGEKAIQTRIDEHYDNKSEERTES
jgi:hypothetical protein